MASSASVGTSASTSAAKAQLFYSAFGSRIQDLQAKVDAAQTTIELDPVLRDISAARSDLTEATAILPAHDRQTHEANLSSLTRSLTDKRKALQPTKAGFTFRRTPKAVTTAPTPSSAPQPPTVGAAASSSTSPLPTGAGSTIAGSSTTPTTSHLSIVSKRGVYISLSHLPIPPSSSSVQHDLHLTDLEDCIIDLRPPARSEADDEGGTVAVLELGALQIRNLSRCILLTGQVKGSVMVHDVRNSWLLIERCRQFRMHTSMATAIALSTTGSIATIEACRRLIFLRGGMPASLIHRPPSSPPHSSDVPPLQVQDFDALLSSSHLAASTPSGQPGGGPGSANWSIVEPDGEVDCAAETLADAARTCEASESGTDIRETVAEILTALQLTP